MSKAGISAYVKCKICGEYTYKFKYRCEGCDCTLEEVMHGKIVSTRHDPYHDVTVYADGHERLLYIGE